MQSELDILVWKNVWRLAQEKGWNKSELARRVGTPPQTINNICKATGKGIGPNLRARFAMVLEMQFHRKETQAQMELLREYLADPGENSGVPPGSEDLTGGTRAKKAV